MATSETKITMTSGATVSVTESVEEVDDHILKVIAGEGRGVTEGWRFAYLTASSGEVRVNIDRIESFLEISRTGRTMVV